MLYTIDNGQLRLTVDTLGAQIMSVKNQQGLEYLWQGDPHYWADRAPVLFPIIGRLEKEQYRAAGKGYSISIHGFAAQAEFSVLEHGRDCLVLCLEASPETLSVYPFPFTLEITYRLEDDRICIENRVTNRGDSTMSFGLGGHPGFRVPLEENEVFQDYYLEFATACQPDRIGFTDDTILLNGHNAPYPLENEKQLALRHDLFDRDAIILQNMAREVKLASKNGSHSVTVTYPDMPYLGIWHWPKTDAPYVCIEPWTSLPGRTGTVEEITCRSDFIHLPAHQAWKNTWYITIA